MDRKALAPLEALLHQGKSQPECAKVFGVSVRTIGRVVARIKTSDNRR
jgi:transposase